MSGIDEIDKGWDKLRGLYGDWIQGLYTRARVSPTTCAAAHHRGWLLNNGVSLWSDVKTDHPAEYLRDLAREGRSRSYIKDRMGMLALYYNYLAKLGLLSPSPMRRIVLSAPDRYDDVEISDADWESLLCSSPLHRVLLRLIGECGLSTLEISRCTRDDFSLGFDWLLLCRDGTERIIRFSPGLVADFSDYIKSAHGGFIQSGRRLPVFVGRPGVGYSREAVRQFVGRLEIDGRKLSTQSVRIYYIRTQMEQGETVGGIAASLGIRADSKEMRVLLRGVSPCSID